MFVYSVLSVVESADRAGIESVVMSMYLKCQELEKCYRSNNIQFILYYRRKGTYLILRSEG